MGWAFLLYTYTTMPAAFIIQATDFTPGKFELNVEKSTLTELEKYIERYEEQYLIDLLGVELFKLFKASITNAFTPPPAGIYLDIFNPIQADDGSEVRISRGIKDMLLGFIWFEFVRNQKYEHTKAGVVKNKVENSTEASWPESDIYGRYNESIASYETIQWYIVKNKTATVYEKYNGQCKEYNHWA